MTDYHLLAYLQQIDESDDENEEVDMHDNITTKQTLPLTSSISNSMQSNLFTEILWIIQQLWMVDTYLYLHMYSITSQKLTVANVALLLGILGIKISIVGIVLVVLSCRILPVSFVLFLFVIFSVMILMFIPLISVGVFFYLMHKIRLSLKEFQFTSFLICMYIKHIQLSGIGKQLVHPQPSIASLTLAIYRLQATNPESPIFVTTSTLRVQLCLSLLSVIMELNELQIICTEEKELVKCREDLQDNAAIISLSKLDSYSTTVADSIIFYLETLPSSLFKDKSLVKSHVSIKQQSPTSSTYLYSTEILSPISMHQLILLLNLYILLSKHTRLLSLGIRSHRSFKDANIVPRQLKSSSVDETMARNKYFELRQNLQHARLQYEAVLCKLYLCESALEYNDDLATTFLSDRATARIEAAAKTLSSDTLISLGCGPDQLLSESLQSVFVNFSELIAVMKCQGKLDMKIQQTDLIDVSVNKEGCTELNGIKVNNSGDTRATIEKQKDTLVYEADAMDDISGSIEGPPSTTGPLNIVEIFSSVVLHDEDNAAEKTTRAPLAAGLEEWKTGRILSQRLVHELQHEIELRKELYPVEERDVTPAVLLPGPTNRNKHDATTIIETPSTAMERDASAAASIRHRLNLATILISSSSTVSSKERNAGEEGDVTHYES